MVLPVTASDVLPAPHLELLEKVSLLVVPCQESRNFKGGR